METLDQGSKAQALTQCPTEIWVRVLLLTIHRAWVKWILASKHPRDSILIFWSNKQPDTTANLPLIPLGLHPPDLEIQLGKNILKSRKKKHLWNEGVGIE